jgi:probable rRNA maturation factor
MAELEVSAQAADGAQLPVALEEVERAARSVLLAESVEAGELSITFVLDPEIARLNQEYVGHEGPTDVISFQLPDPADRVVGDIYIGAEQAARQAAELGTDPREELLRLAMHGTLHILGHEHPEDDARDDSPMYRRQEELLAAFLRDARPLR